MRMPDITLESALPDRRNVTFGSMARIALLTVVSIGMAGTSVAMLWRHTDGIANRVSRLADLSEMFGWDLFFVVREDLLQYIFGGLIISPVIAFFCIAAFRKCFQRLPQQIDKEWY